MKRILYVFALLAVLLVVSTPAHATRATTTNRCIACMSEQLLDEIRAARVQISLAPTDPR